jgi:hypothetical protein
LAEENPPIGDLTKLMMFFGRISEVHMKNLQSYPYIFFNEIEAAQLDYNVATADKSEPTIFSYTLLLNLEANDQLEKRYKALEDAVRKLFWKEARIKVTVNMEEVYESE